MTKNIKKILVLVTSFIVLIAEAQLKKGQLLDGVVAIIGDEIILQSDIDEQTNFAKQHNMHNADKCDIMENLLNNKFLIYHAKKDTLIPNRNKEIREQVAHKYEQILGQFPSEKAMLDAYKFNSAYDMKNTIEKIDIDAYYGQSKYARITEKIDITPNEVTDFYNVYKFQLPEVKEEVVLAQIVMYPKLTDKHKNEIIEKLKKIKQDILNGESFELSARIHSEDTGSASNGGLYENISRGKMVKAFEATALNLQEGEISDPIETEYGYHIIQLIKKKGKLYDARHILIKSTPNEEEIFLAKQKLEDIKQQILDGKITFKEASYKYSDNKNTKYNSGIITGENGSTRIEKTSLPANISYQIAGYNKGDITEVFQDELNQKKIVSLIKIEDSIPSHQLDLSKDYDRVKNFALNDKKNKNIEKWVKENLPNTFIFIDKKYSHCNFKIKWNK